MPTPSKTVCVILAYNCAPMLESTVARIPKGSVDRIILVDDASTDNTLEVARRLGIESYTHPHLGYGGNIKYSIRKSIELGAEYIVDLHGDGQYDPAAIPAALAKAREGYDLILGSRFTDRKQPRRDGMPLSRYLANIGLSAIERFVLGVPISEFHTGFRVYTKRLAERVPLDATSDDFLFGFEIIAQAVYAGLKIGEVPIRCNYKKEHTSISIPRSIKYSFQTFKTLAEFTLARWGFPSKLFPGRFGGTRPAYEQVVRYGIVGCFVLAVNLGLLYLFTDIFHIYYLISNALAFLIAFSTSFLLQKTWTFKDYSTDRLHVQIPFFLLIQLINITLNTALIYLFVEYLHVWYILAEAIIAVGLAIAIFFVNKYYIFKTRNALIS